MALQPGQLTCTPLLLSDSLFPDKRLSNRLLHETLHGLNDRADSSNVVASGWTTNDSLEPHCSRAIDCSPTATGPGAGVSRPLASLRSTRPEPTPYATWQSAERIALTDQHTTGTNSLCDMAVSGEDNTIYSN
jgi:hypothetical protein